MTIPTLPTLRRSGALLFLAVSATALAATACGSDSASTTTTPSTTLDSATQLPGAGGPIAELDIVVSHPDREADLVYTVGCLGDTFPVTPEVEGVDGEVGCAALADETLRSRLLDGPPADQACTLQYGGPDEAVITGTIDGQAVDAVVTRADGCEIFTWEALLGLLPPAIGVTN